MFVCKYLCNPGSTFPLRWKEPSHTTCLITVSTNVNGFTVNTILVFILKMNVTITNQVSNIEYQISNIKYRGDLFLLSGATHVYKSKHSPVFTSKSPSRYLLPRWETSEKVHQSPAKESKLISSHQ